MSKNLILEGDGLTFLAQLAKESYDLIMTDPPYNESKSKGKYVDSWRGKSERYPWARESGKYIEFLADRFIPSRELLKPHGLIMVFIGDGEPHRIRILLEEIYGEKNYVGTLIWESSSNVQKSKIIDRNHEYVLIFAKDIGAFKKKGGLFEIDSHSPMSEMNRFAQELDKSLSYEVKQSFYRAKLKQLKNKDISHFKYILPDTHAPFNVGPSGDPRNGSKVPLRHPLTGKECPLPAKGKGWRFSQEYLDLIQGSKNIYPLVDGKVLVYEPHPKVLDIKGIVFGPDETTVPGSCHLYSEKTDKTVLPTTGYVYKGDKKEGISHLNGFETVKPHEFLMKLLLNYPVKDANVLDFFAGSGSTAVSVEKANLVDQGKRTWTLIELNSVTVHETMIKKLHHFKINDFKVLKKLDCITHL